MSTATATSAIQLTFTGRATGHASSLRWSLGRCVVGRGVPQHQIEELAEGDAGFQVVTEVGSASHHVVVASPQLLLVEIAQDHQVVHDVLNGPLSDPDCLCDIAGPGVGISRQ
jgi:hypothetical protein